MVIFVQGVVILVGFISAGYLISEAFKDWEQNPVLTTLESIATPVR